MYDFQEPRGMHILAEIFKMVESWLEVSLQLSVAMVRVEKTSSMLAVNNSQSAFLKFLRSTGFDLKELAYGGVVIKLGRCWERGEAVNQESLVEVTPGMFVMKVTSGWFLFSICPNEKMTVVWEQKAQLGRWRRVNWPSYDRLYWSLYNPKICGRS